MSRFILAGVLLMACDPAAQPDPEPPANPGVRAPEVDGDDLGDVDAQPDDLPPARSLRRMNVDQIRDSMARVTGGISWSTTQGRDIGWDRFSETLGKPDYRGSVNEDLSPSVLFQKFLDDAANQSCEAWLRRDLSDGGTFFVAGGPPEDGTQVTEQVRYLRRRIQGISGSSDPDDVAAYVGLHDLVVQRTDDRVAAWRAVCVALFTHPDFYAY